MSATQFGALNLIVMQIYGIDLSMEKFDVNYIDQKVKKRNKCVKNKLINISEFLDTVPCNAILCAENTGPYGDLLVFLCNQMGIKIALVSGYTIKHSFGMIKGKSDTIDAERIREYGERFGDKLIFKQYDTEDVFELKSLYALRSQLVKACKILQTGKHSRVNAPMQSISTKRHTEKALKELRSEIRKIEDEIEVIILNNEELKENYELVTSITGIGPVIATDLIIKTGNFKTINTARKAASYAGICPFPDQSGKMRKKGKISPFGDKKLKSLLYMGTRSAVKHNKEYRLYYQKKQLEGKPHYLIMNNVSNKMLRTIYSIVLNKRPYSQEYICYDPRELKNINSSDEKVA